MVGVVVGLIVGKNKTQQHSELQNMTAYCKTKQKYNFQANTYAYHGREQDRTLQGSEGKNTT